LKTIHSLEKIEKFLKGCNRKVVAKYFGLAKFDYFFLQIVVYFYDGKFYNFNGLCVYNGTLNNI